MALLRNRRHFLLLHKTPPFIHTIRPITSSSQTQNNSLPPNPGTSNKKQPLHALFMEVVGLRDKTPTTPQQQDEESSENRELKKNLKQLDEELISLKGKNNKEAVTTMTNVGSKKRMSLFAVFSNKPDRDGGGGGGDVRNEKRVKLIEPKVLKKLSPDMEIFVEHLFRNGYFNGANFAKGKERFDLSWFENYFARGYVKFAVQRFGSDNQEIAKWLSGSALKQVAVFGCPSTDRATVFPAKRLRTFFEVPENTVCSKCVLQESCKFANQSVWNGNTKTLDLVVVMKVLTAYALEMVHHRLVVPDEVHNSVCRLLKEVVKLSQTT